MLEPGTVQFPDHRVVSRLLTSLKTFGDGTVDWVPGLILGLMPIQVQAMIGMISMESTEGILNSIVRVWWEFNGRTTFLSHHLTAKLVRRMAKCDDRAWMAHEFDEDMFLPAPEPYPVSPTGSPTLAFF